MQIELGLIGAVSLMGGAVQLRILHVLERKLKEIAEEQRRRDEEADLDASGKFADLEREKTEWENERIHARSGSGHSGTPLMNEDPTASSQEGRSSTPTLNATRGRYASGVSDFLAPAPDDEPKAAPKKQARRGLKGLLPNLDFGTGIQDDVPTGFITEAEPESRESKEAKDAKKAQISAELEELARKEELLTEIQTIRRSIDALRSDVDSDESRSRRISLTSRRTLSCDLGTVMGSRSHTRPPRQPDPRIRTNSMEFSKVIDAPPLGASITRPTSAPLKNEDWDSYVKDRKLLQPPSGVTAPIPTTPVSSRVPMAPAVTEALAQRKRRESSLLDINPNESTARKSSEEDVPVARTLAGMLGLGVKKHPARTSGGIPSVLLQQPGCAPPPEPPSRGLPSRSKSVRAASGEATNTHIPLVLPPTRPLKATSQAIAAPVPQKAESPRVATFEELEERHRHKMRGMQAPLTQAEKEHAEVEAAKNRWERSRAIEREVVSKRQAEKAAQLEREEKGRRKPQDGQGKRGSGVADAGKLNALSAEKLAAVGGGHASTSSKRQSMMRVEDWQRHQQDVEMGVRPRESRAMASATVPFPGGRVRASVPRDPPN